MAACKCKKIVKTVEVTTVNYDPECFSKALKAEDARCPSSVHRNKRIDLTSSLKSKKSQQDGKGVTSKCCKCEEKVETFEVETYEYDDACLAKLKQLMVQKKGCLPVTRLRPQPQHIEVPQPRPQTFNQSPTQFCNLIKCCHTKKKSEMLTKWPLSCPTIAKCRNAGAKQPTN